MTLRELLTNALEVDRRKLTYVSPDDPYHAELSEQIAEQEARIDAISPEDEARHAHDAATDEAEAEADERAWAEDADEADETRDDEFEE